MLTSLVQPRSILPRPLVVNTIARRYANGTCTVLQYLHTVTNPLRQYRVSMGTAVALTVAVPAAYYLPNVVPDLICLIALPPHAALGLNHVIHDYLPGLPAEPISIFFGVVLFLALLRLMWEGTGFTQVLSDLWKE